MKKGALFALPVQLLFYFNSIWDTDIIQGPKKIFCCCELGKQTAKKERLKTAWIPHLQLNKLFISRIDKYYLETGCNTNTLSPIRNF